MDPWPTTATSDPFDRAQRQLLDEERALRALAEGQVREFRRMVVEFASAFLAEELDARRRADPRFTERATPADWRQLLCSARQEQSAAARWSAASTVVDEAARWQAEAERLTGEVARLAAELELARAFRPAEPAPDLKLADLKEINPQGRAPESPAPASLLPAPAKPAAEPGLAPAVNALGLADVRLPALPPVAPPRFADQLQAWPREALALAVLGVTGWSMRLAVADQMSAALGSVKANAGSLRRTYSVLAKRGFWIEQKVTLTGVHAPAPDADGAETRTARVGGPAEDTTLVVVRLGDLGRDLLRSCGVQPVLSEWERLLAAHGGRGQQAHVGLTCALTYHARLRGWATAVCPPGAGPCAADVLLLSDGETLLVEVISGEALAEDARSRCVDQAAQQGRAALMALTPESRNRLVAEAQAGGIEHGLATDLQTLLNTQEARGPLWAVEW